MPPLRLAPRLLFTLVVVASFALLVMRSRPLQRFTGGAQALLYATGLDGPRALYSLDDGTILAAEGGRRPRVVEIGVDGQITARPESPSALLWPDEPSGSEAVVAFPRVGTAWGVARAPDRTTIASLPHANRVIRIEEGGAARTLAGDFRGSGGRNPLPTAAAFSATGELFV
ncbi:MAG: hypothetical protein ACR2NO_07870, partial [Chloroflexota bacterium]